ncbi:hypothetical protein PCURB6_13920 [Paenibacillus curdlanolyticus]|nr:hypothetical protein PCURB6_13920 [Paenibacillus curdlanolyticus]
MQEGYRIVVDIDLEKFFDRVNHDRLMAKLAERVKDKILLKLICAYLQAGVMENGLVRGTEEGTPQVGPLSPLLSNIVLNELDKELEKRQLRFVRYADDCNIYVKTWKAGQRVMNSISLFIERKLKLKVNREKSAVDRPWNRKFPGFTSGREKAKPQIRIASQSLQRVKAKIRAMTSRSRSTPMEIRIRELNQYLMGWCGYYVLAETKSVFQELDAWTRSELRMCKWKQWKLPKTKVRELISLGVPKHKAYE